MLKEYRYRDRKGVFIYFMDDRKRAISLHKKGIEVENKTMDPFTNYPFHIFDPKQDHQGNRKGTTKYDYDDFLRLQELREKGLCLYQISKIAGICPQTITTVLEGKRQGYRLFIEKYKRISEAG